VLDIERLALDVPGTRVARARAWAGVHPVLGSLHAPGTVTVVVVPDLAVPHPQPSAGLLGAIRRHLCRRRIVCMRVEVVGPRYLEVGVEARVVIHPLASPARVTTAIAAALDAFLDPRTGGPQRRGWPFGRDVYRTEILQAIHAVPGVDHVETMTLVAEGIEPTCGNVTVCPTWLVTPGPHRLVAERSR
jgi:predicted phage baseplate assembly protein